MQKFTSIGKKSLLAILIVSTLVTTLFTFISFGMDYSNEMDSLIQNLNLIESTSSDPLSRAIWDFNDDQIKNLLQGITKVDNFIKAEVLSPDKAKVLYNSQIENYHQFANKMSISHEFQLIHHSDKKDEVIGILKVTATKAGIFAKLFKKAMIFFLLQGLKTTCISFLILWIFRKLILGHIEEIHHYLKSSTESKFKFAKPLELNRSLKINDEFTHLTQIINDMVKIIGNHQEILTKKLDETTQILEIQKERSIHAAKMASLGEMAGGISHEINNPLTIISGKLSILRRKNELGPVLQTELAEYLDLMSKTSERIAKIIKGLKTFARDGSSDPMLACSLNQILLDSLIICDDKIKKHGIIFNIKNIQNVQVNAREVEITQIIVNLISNSVDAIEHLEEKWIKITSNFHDGFIELIFTDSGKGIPKAVADKIMEPFFTTKEINKGTGLGLSISKGIIESHGGTLYIDHEKPNTTFVMKIPAMLIEKVS